MTRPDGFANVFQSLSFLFVANAAFYGSYRIHPNSEAKALHTQAVLR